MKYEILIALNLNAVEHSHWSRNVSRSVQIQSEIYQYFIFHKLCIPAIRYFQCWIINRIIDSLSDLHITKYIQDLKLTSSALAILLCSARERAVMVFKRIERWIVGEVSTPSSVDYIFLKKNSILNN